MERGVWWWYDGLEKHNKIEEGKKTHTDRNLMTGVRAGNPISNL